MRLLLCRSQRQFAFPMGEQVMHADIYRFDSSPCLPRTRYLCIDILQGLDGAVASSVRVCSIVTNVQHVKHGLLGTTCYGGRRSC